MPAQRFPSQYSLRFNLGFALAASVLFWIQFTLPSQAVGCWVFLGAMLFLAVSYPNRFWAATTGIFGFEGGLLVGMLFGVQNHWLWLLGGFIGGLALTVAEHVRLDRLPPRRGKNSELRIESLLREIGLGAFAGYLASSFLRSELARLFILAALIIGLRYLMDRKRTSQERD